MRRCRDERPLLMSACLPGWLRRPQRMRDAGIIHLALVALGAIAFVFAEARHILNFIADPSVLITTAVDAVVLIVAASLEIWVGVRTMSGRRWAIAAGFSHWLFGSVLVAWMIFVAFPPFEGVRDGQEIVSCLAAGLLAVPLSAYGVALYAYFANRAGRRADPAADGRYPRPFSAHPAAAEDER